MIKRYLSTVTSSVSNDDINEGFRKIIATSLTYNKYKYKYIYKSKYNNKISFKS